MRPWKDLQLSRRGIAIDPSTGESFRLNESAAAIFSQLQKDRTPHEIATALAADFDTSYESALSDVYEFVANLRIQGVQE